VLISPFNAPFFRVADPDWPEPLDPGFAAQGDGQRWNPTGLPCLYLNFDVQTARANVNHRFEGQPFGPADLDPATAPTLIEVSVPSGMALDASTDAGLESIGLPISYPVDAAGTVIPHDTCQPIGAAAFVAGHDGVDCRSAAPGGVRELAWFPREQTATETTRQPFETWW
jgi:hypothetical protein